MSRKSTHDSDVANQFTYWTSGIRSRPVRMEVISVQEEETYSYDRFDEGAGKVEEEARALEDAESRPYSMGFGGRIEHGVEHLVCFRAAF